MKEPIAIPEPIAHSIDEGSRERSMHWRKCKVCSDYMKSASTGLSPCRPCMLKAVPAYWSPNMVPKPELPESFPNFLDGSQAFPPKGPTGANNEPCPPQIKNGFFFESRLHSSINLTCPRGFEPLTSWFVAFFQAFLPRFTVVSESLESNII